MKKLHVGICVMLLLSLTFIVLPVPVQAATIYSTTSGWWQNASTWIGGAVPGAGDTAYICTGHTVHLNDNRTVFQVNVNTTAKLLLMGSTCASCTIGWTITLKFDDSANSGFLTGTAGTLQATGDALYGVTITTAAAGAPTNYFNLYAASATFRWAYTTVSYSTKMGPNLTDFDDVTISYTKNAETYVWATSSSRTLTQFVDVTIDNLPASLTRGALYFYSLTYTDLQNIVIEDSATVNAVSVHSARLEFTDSNFDINDIEHYTCGVGLCMVTSNNHNDVAGAFKISINDYAAKSDITNDYGSGDDIEIVTGRFNIDEASASNDYTVASAGTMNVSYGNTHTFDSGANLTVNGVAELNGTVTTASGYFEFYNPGTVWLNNSTIEYADMALPFNFYVGHHSNSSINDYTANMGTYDLLVAISSETYSAKGSGIVWHMNATVQCVACFEVVEVDFGNLTSGESYRLYNNGVLVGTKTADGSGMVFFTTTIDDTADHLNLTHYTAPTETTPGPWVDILPIIVKIRYSYDLMSNVRVWLDVNESYPMMDYFVWRLGDGRQWITFVPYLNFSRSWSLRDDVPLTVEVRNIEGVKAELSATVQIDHSWIFILAFTIILCVTVSYLVASRYDAIVRKLRKDVKL